MVLPLGIVSTGFPAVEATCGKLDLSFDPWQRDLNACILGKDVDAFYAADTVVMSIPRQVGKTWDVGALIFADCIVNPDTTVIWTAHRFKVSRETFDTLRALASTPAVKPFIENMTTGAGNEQIIFHNGSRIVFAARERGAIRGFTKVRRLILDEGQILTEAALSDLVPTMNQADNPQIIIMGTPPKPKDPGEVFTRLRSEALSGESEGVLYVEFSADLKAILAERHTGDLRTDVALILGDDDLLDAVMRQCNPSYPHRTSMRAVKRMLKLLVAEDAGREAFGIWDEDEVGDEFFGAGNWQAVQRTALELPDTPNAVGLAVSVDRAYASLAAAYTVDVDGEQVTAVARLGQYEHIDEAIAEALRLKELHQCAAVIDGSGPAADSLDAVQIAQFTVLDLGAYATACAGLFDDIRERRILVAAHDDFDAELDVVDWRFSGDSRVLGRRKSAGNIMTLEAATCARHGSLTTTDAWGFYS